MSTNNIDVEFENNSAVVPSPIPSTPPRANFLTRRRLARQNAAVRNLRISIPPGTPSPIGTPSTGNKTNASRNLSTRRGRVAAMSRSTSPASTVSNASSVTASTNSFEPNVSSVTIDPKVVFPDATNHIIDVKRQISTVSREIEALRPKLTTAINSVKTLGSLNVGDKSFRGSAGPQVYVAHNSNVNDYVVRGNFMAEGRPFRITNENSFNSVLSQMKKQRQAAKGALTELGSVQTQIRSLETKLAGLDKNLKNSTVKLRRNMANYTAKHAKGLRSESRAQPTVRATVSSNSQAANALLQTQAPKKGFLQRFFGRGGANSSRRTRRNSRR